MEINLIYTDVCEGKSSSVRRWDSAGDPYHNDQGTIFPGENSPHPPPTHTHTALLSMHSLAGQYECQSKGYIYS